MTSALELLDELDVPMNCPECGSTNLSVSVESDKYSSLVNTYLGCNMCSPFSLVYSFSRGRVMQILTQLCREYQSQSK